MGQLLPGKRLQQAVSVALGIYFGLAALTDLGGAVLIVPGVAPPGSPRTFQVVTGLVILLLAVALLLPRLSRHAATALVLVWLLRTVWDMTGGPPMTWAWTLVLGALVVVRAKTRGESAPATER
jgi:hypothetical protein